MSTIYNKPLAILVVLTTFFLSCTKKESINNLQSLGDAKIEISISTVSSKNANIAKDKLADNNSLKNKFTIDTSGIRMDQVIDLGSAGKIKATLINETLLENYSNNLLATTTPQSKVLDAGVKYRVIAYNSDGSYEDHKDFEYGNESLAGDFMLTGGIQGAYRTYTFVVYSMNSTTKLPEIPNIKTSNINTVELEASPTDGQLLFFKRDIPIKKGNNKLNITLDHIFSQITTTINVVDQPLGYLNKISNPRFTPQANTVTVKFNSSNSDPTYTYNPQADNIFGSPISFPAITGTSTKSISSTPTFIASAQTTSGTLEIDELVIYAVLEAAPVPKPLPIDKRISIKNVKITPGHRYNLILNYDIPCVEVVEYTDSKFAWYQASGDVTAKEILMDPTDFGFSFDIYRLDNSFNMLVNDQNVITAGAINSTELQFESGFSTAPINLKFDDGSYWGSGASQIYWLYSYYGTGTTNGNGDTNNDTQWSIDTAVHTPILKIIIDVEGGVHLYGRKQNDDLDFYKIIPNQAIKDGDTEPSNALTFNTVEWKKEGQNKVTISQKAIGVSAMLGYGRGYRLKLCSPPALSN